MRIESITKTLLVFTVFFFAVTVAANDLNNFTNLHVVNVRGHGDIEFDYDLATLKYEISVEGEDQLETQNKLADAVAKFDALTAEFEIDEDQVEQGNSQIYSVPKTSGFLKTNIQNSYFGSISRDIEFTDFEIMKAFAEAAERLDLDLIPRLYYDLQNKGPVAQKVEALAIQDAKSRAIDDAHRANVTVINPKIVGQLDTGVNGDFVGELIFDESHKLLPFDVPTGRATSNVEISYSISAPDMMETPISELYVTGEADQKIAPEFATTIVRIEELNKDRNAAEAALSKQIEGIKEDLISMGLEEGWITIYSPIVQTVYADRELPFMKRYVDGYKAYQEVEIEFHDFTQISTVIAKMVAAGFDNYSNLRFEVEDREPYEVAVRDAAFEDAQEIAQSRANALGMKLGAPIEINAPYYDSGNYGNVAYEAATDAVMADGVEVKQIEVKVNDVTFRDNVNIRYELLPN